MTQPAPPMGLIAELTHRCPLQCAYCSNPLQMDAPKTELSTDDWRHVLDQAAAIGILQVHFSGGEPMARRDLPELVAHASRAGLYTNIITSGVLLTDEAMAALLAGGIDHIQLSFQDATHDGGDRFGGYRGGHEKKLAAARRIREAGLPLTANFVIHKQNIERVEAMIALGETLEAERMEIAHTQYYGWALLNRNALLPSREQLDYVNAVVEAARARLKGRIAIDYVVPDYYASRPKACMGGWGNRFINISPSGKTLPCHAAETLPGFTFPSVRETSLRDIWQASDAFTRFRGTDWMPEPCRACDRREIDWGGCRCQALAMTGDVGRTDPACHRAPDHDLMAQAVVEADAETVLDLVPRRLHQAAHD
ncbi:MAG: pyrroloquinoline quinone biosynthesis protein PqqE [Novosphingobium sp. 16-62-11]|uniref:pyrroloquinoline quinone biosynthesis protein PqqE n=1 Tax=Novosphingobium sp. 17-62-19 TaxID=1970406 RepID=UPI000BD6BF45|nr:pyrroloquinoline quinone biosynthesis protein PqqE [Novosphingobium sp. 17-62-19]OYX96199.1 MAG: pyrroloquinoline quinone biosynthesis protein PqqE [Novosphingobium sp. 35-62-5]OYZ46732.1 MAG: pyrroloquinoline quinone biosynthesis protein PqqE [Novosphingobium sp. 16-62-11]OZA16908.1 MAG: pyrroloquinoline quinone biosynthesis protein PqqE [Novosphingobium sp. 17-62-19]OZA72708.1 MAG: pyrroloquinoline quinone biosynthesis protein PqqE [Sphingomonadales bacterium 39-62-4]